MALDEHAVSPGVGRAGDFLFHVRRIAMRLGQPDLQLPLLGTVGVVNLDPARVGWAGDGRNSQLRRLVHHFHDLLVGKIRRHLLAHVARLMGEAPKGIAAEDQSRDLELAELDFRYVGRLRFGRRRIRRFHRHGRRRQGCGVKQKPSSREGMGHDC
jgi:hypothetical protein